MNKRTWVYILVLSVILSFVFELFFGRFLSAKLSMVPGLNRLGLLSPQAPIIINTQREVRISDSADIQELGDKIKPFLANVVVSTPSQVSFSGTAVQLSSDGLFLTALDSVKLAGAKYSIRTAQGQIIEVTGIVVDPASGLVILRTKATNLSVVSFGVSDSLAAGSKLVLASAGSIAGVPRISAGYAQRTQRDMLTDPLESDALRVSIGVSLSDSPAVGTVVVNADGDVVGMWDGKTILSSDFIKSSVDNFFQDRKTFQRLGWGFRYREVLDAESELLQVSGGVLVVAVDTGKPASSGGLKPGDVITAVNGRQISGSLPLHQILLGINSASPIAFSVVRAGQTLTLSITPVRF